MGYKGKNDKEKEENRACGKACWFSRQKITKQIVGEKRCNDISFRPLSGYCQKGRMQIKLEPLPKAWQHALKNQRKRKSIFGFR